jgi:hypothetical protein
MLNHKNADRRRQIALLALSCDITDQTRHRDVLGMSDFFKLSPENIFKANASFVSIKLDGTFNYGFHKPMTHENDTNHKRNRAAETVTWMAIGIVIALIAFIAIYFGDLGPNSSSTGGP